MQVIELFVDDYLKIWAVGRNAQLFKSFQVKLYKSNTSYQRESICKFFIPLTSIVFKFIEIDGMVL